MFSLEIFVVEFIILGVFWEERVVEFEVRGRGKLFFEELELVFDNGGRGGVIEWEEVLLNEFR